MANRVLCSLIRPWSTLQDMVMENTYQVGKKWVQMLRVSLVMCKVLSTQSQAELRGCRYPEMMLSSQNT